ncbi:hypothetical protein IBX65_06360 [Candidatus Aerophobetes bacterium]|nr:hypothetical protein [Candidatus Aerophobetes bacterium]
MKQTIDLPEGMRKIDALIAVGLYKTRTQNIKENLKSLLSGYDVKPVYEVREKLNKQLKTRLSDEVRKIREEEMH